MRNVAKNGVLGVSLLFLSWGYYLKLGVLLHFESVFLTVYFAIFFAEILGC